MKHKAYGKNQKSRGKYDAAGLEVGGLKFYYGKGFWGKKILTLVSGIASFLVKRKNLIPNR